MKSLVRSAPSPKAKAEGKEVLPKSAEAQCCAKVSKTVAGCHD